MGGVACASSGQHAIAIACMPVMPILASSNAQTLYIQVVIIISVHSYVCVSWSFSNLRAPVFAWGAFYPTPLLMSCPPLAQFHSVLQLARCR